MSEGGGEGQQVVGWEVGSRPPRWHQQLLLVPSLSRSSLPLLVEDWGLTYSALFRGTEEVMRKGRR